MAGYDIMVVKYNFLDWCKMFIIRPLTPVDVPCLTQIDARFTSETILDVIKTGAGLEISWRLVERRLPAPERTGRDYTLCDSDLDSLSDRLAQNDGLYLVAEINNRIAGLLDLQYESWNNTAWLWNLLVDRTYRRQGLGRRLFQAGVSWARRRGARAIIIETQSNNAPACRFYAAMGCELVGLNDFYYSNSDLELGEVALFWAYRLDDGAPGAP